MSNLRELPVFPLPEVVLFPGSPLPLHIFEYRYRMMMASVLETDKRFGVLMWNPQEGRPADVGCCAEILRHERLPDGRMMILTLGQQRFQVLNYVREKPFRVALVEWIEDESPTEDVQSLASEVKKLLQDVVRLSAKLTDQEVDLPDKYPALPREFSYWVASNFQGAPLEQQALLEMQDTAGRLRRESEILASTRSHLAARTALKEVFKDQAGPNL
jgi:ATP-dependent Lon protease